MSADAIDREIADAKVRLVELYAEKRRRVRARIDAIVAEFTAGQTIAEISQARSVSDSTIRCVVHRAGRTTGGRTAIRAKILAITGGSNVVRP